MAFVQNPAAQDRTINGSAMNQDHQFSAIIHGRIQWLGKVLASTLFVSATAFAAPAAASSVLHVSDDGGGSIQHRVLQINAIRSAGGKVEIRSGYCHSACTLFLALPETCVSPHVEFGFHGPGIAAKGLVMLPSQFEHWSQIMAAHYPPPLQKWFMQTARHSRELIILKGDQLITLGVPQCT
jgi:hypothetical protein